MTVILYRRLNVRSRIQRSLVNVTISLKGVGALSLFIITCLAGPFFLPFIFSRRAKARLPSRGRANWSWWARSPGNFTASSSHRPSRSSRPLTMVRFWSRFSWNPLRRVRQVEHLARGVRAKAIACIVGDLGSIPLAYKWFCAALRVPVTPCTFYECGIVCYKKGLQLFYLQLLCPVNSVLPVLVCVLVHGQCNFIELNEPYYSQFL